MYHRTRENTASAILFSQLTNEGSVVNIRLLGVLPRLNNALHVRSYRMASPAEDQSSWVKVVRKRITLKDENIIIIIILSAGGVIGSINSYTAVIMFSVVPIGMAAHGDLAGKILVFFSLFLKAARLIQWSDLIFGPTGWCKP